MARKWVTATLVGALSGGCGYGIAAWSLSGDSTAGAEAGQRAPSGRLRDEVDADSKWSNGTEPASPGWMTRGPQTCSLSPRELSALRSLIREEMKAALGERTDGTCAGDSEDEAPSSEQLLEFDQAQALVDQAIDSGRWTPEDRERLQEITRDFSGAALNEVLSPLMTQINEDAVRVIGFAGDAPF